jgi:hypothetical protein
MRQAAAHLRAGVVCANAATYTAESPHIAYAHPSCTIVPSIYSAFSYTLDVIIREGG